MLAYVKTKIRQRRERALAECVPRMLAACDTRANRTASPKEKQRAPDQTAWLARKFYVLCRKLGLCPDETIQKYALTR